ncbi:MAG: hypothetical protein HZC15_04480 [Candidatus Omnitrophica bacterium]|nr:hypothetical protein [Candidatus Omnitrophota bacterium]
MLVLDEARLVEIPEDSLLNELDRSITPSAAKADCSRISKKQSKKDSNLIIFRDIVVTDL